MSWYGQKRAGFWQANDEGTVKGVRLLPRGYGYDYVGEVIDKVDDILSTGYQGWIAPEGHQGRDKPKEQWVWRFANTNHMLEAVYAHGVPLEQIEYIAKMNKGMGWRFPKIFIFRQAPPEQFLTMLRACGCPWGIEAELRERPDIEPPPGDWKTEVKYKLDAMGGMARDILDIIEKV